MHLDAVQSLIVLLAGAALINVVFAAALWRSTRDRLFKYLFVAWTATIASGLVQGALVQGDLIVTLGFSSVFLANAAFAHLLGATADVPVRWRWLLAILALGLAGSLTAATAGAPFVAVALPTAIAVAAPSVSVGVDVFRLRWSRLHAQGRALTLSCILFSVHNLDFAFLRGRPSFAALGFAVATLVVFAIAISAPATLLDIVTRREATLQGQLEIARTIQTRLVPPDSRLGGLDFAAYMRPTDSVGGDYLHRFRVGDVEWFFVGDVTGHGFGAGLFTLMAHSAFASIIEARPEISPRDLNHLANRVLCASLARLHERRSMTIVSMRRDGRTGGLTVSGSHDDLLLYRASSGLVDAVQMTHFPFGLGFAPDLELASIGEATFQLLPGDLLFIGTDGVFEAARGGEHLAGLFGAEPVRETLVASPGVSLPEVRRRIVDRLEAFTEGRYGDDVAFLLLRASDGENPA